MSINPTTTTTPTTLEQSAIASSSSPLPEEIPDFTPLPIIKKNKTKLKNQQEELIDDPDQKKPSSSSSAVEEEEPSPKKPLKKSSQRLAQLLNSNDFHDFNETELLNLFEKAEHVQSVVLMCKILNKLLEFRSIYFENLHRMMNVYHKFGIQNSSTEENSQNLDKNLDIYSNYTHLVELFKYLVEIGDSTSFKSHTCDSIGVCLYTMFSKLQIDEFGYIETVYISDNSSNNSGSSSSGVMLLNKSHVYEKSINFFKQALSDDNFDTIGAKMQCYRHLQEVCWLYGEYCAMNSSSTKQGRIELNDLAIENYVKAIEFIKIEYHIMMQNSSSNSSLQQQQPQQNNNKQNIKDFIKSSPIYKKIKRSVQLDFETTTSAAAMVKIDHCVTSSQIIPACSCFTCK